MAQFRGNQSGAMTRRPLRPCDYIAYHDQQKVEALKRRMEEQKISLEAMNKKQTANARKRSAMEAQLDGTLPPSVQAVRQQNQQQNQQQQQYQQQPPPLDPMIADTKKYLELKRRKQAFEDFLLTKRLQKEKAKADRKMVALEKEFKQHNQKQQETTEMVAEMTKKEMNSSYSSLQNPDKTE